MATVNTGAFQFGIHLQSQDIKFNEWLAQFTQCLAPWATHVLVGVPTIVNLTDKSIKWHRYIPLYSPLSIYWRYLIICDRRVRCRDWNPERMAATCTMFWDGSRWSSTERETKEHLHRLVRSPPYSRTPVLSVPMLGTMVVLLQGAQALYEVFNVGSAGFVLTQGVAGVFFPIAVSSFFRLVPAFWITNDFAFRDGPSEDLEASSPATELAHLSNGTALSVNCVTDSEPPIFDSQTCWKAILVRAVAMAIIIAIFVSQVQHISPSFTSSSWDLESASNLAVHFLYHGLVGIMVVLFSYYLCRKRGDDVAIACINSKWYTAWTILWYLGAVAVITINAVEMRRTYCGAYTTFLPAAGLDKQLCEFFK
ncbi:hypothetical protein QBC43DRAFT_338020 [Cladorrhinum sp. PSN259]|nr:hypothetical protein QBC43DRAFT_338020 [Cladorrhinum sp. PSN259]